MLAFKKNEPSKRAKNESIFIIVTKLHIEDTKKWNFVTKNSQLFKTLCYFCRGEMAERLNAPVLKTGIPQGIGGSNPSFSASKGSKRKF